MSRRAVGAPVAWYSVRTVPWVVQGSANASVEIARGALVDVDTHRAVKSLCPATLAFTLVRTSCVDTGEVATGRGNTFIQVNTVLPVSDEAWFTGARKTPVSVQTSCIGTTWKCL